MLDLGKIGYKVEIDDKKYTAMLRKMEGDASGTANNIGSVFRKALAFLGGAMLFREGLRGARMFSDELANIKSIAGELNTRALRREITNLSSDLGSSAELANALYFAYSAGVRGTEKELAAFTGQMAALAKTVGAEATPIMDAATTMMNAYGLSVKDAGMLSDWFYQIVKSGKTTGSELAQSLGQIAATAAASGISIDELGAALATLTTTMPTNIAVTSLAASIRALMNPTDDVKKKAAELGIELSMSAIKAKGFAGVMDDIYQKTQGRGDLIGRLFPAESSRAIMALGGTQIGTLKQNLVDFGNKGGAAAAGFAEKMKSLDNRILALQTSGQKILTVLADMVVQFVTLGGVLNPLLERFVNLKEEGIIFAARLLAMVAGVLLLKKAQNALNLRAMAIEMATVTASTASQTAATDLETAAIMRNTAAIQANKAARSLPGGAMGADDFRRQDIQRRWDERNARQMKQRAERLSREAYEAEFYRRSFGGGASVTGMPQYGRAGETIGKFASSTSETTKHVGRLGSAISAVGKGFSGVASVLSGGMKGMAGAASFAANSLIAIGVAVGGWEIGEWLAEVTGFRKAVANMWAGQDVDEFDRRNEEQIKAREERMKKQEEDAQKAAADAEKKVIEDREAKDRRERRYQAARGYQFSRADTQTQISMLNADLLNAQNKGINAKTDEERTKAQEEYWQTLAKLNETKEKLDDEIKARQDLAREAELAQYRAQLAKDGEISAADELLLKQKEIEQQEQRISAAVERTKKAREKLAVDPTNEAAADKARQALRDEAMARSQYYEMQNRQRQDKIDYANQQRSLQQQLRTNQMIAALRADGEYTMSEQVSVQEQKIADITENLKAAKAALDNLVGDAKLEMQVKISQMELDRVMENMNLKQLKESGQRSQGSFSAELLNLMSGAQAPAEQTAENTRKSLQETRKVRENLEKTPVLKYGSK